MIVPLFFSASQASVWSGKKGWNVGTGQEFNYIWAILPWVGWLWTMALVDFYRSDDPDCDDAVLEIASSKLGFFIGAESTEDGVGVTVADADYSTLKSGAIEAGGRGWDIGSGREFEKCMFLYPGTYEYEEDPGEYVDFLFWTFRLIRSDGTEMVVFSTEGSVISS